MKNKIRKIEMSLRYEKGLKLCKHWGNDFAVIKSYLTDILADNLLGLSKYLNRQKKLNICDIGAGEGTISKHLLSTLLPLVKTACVDFIEPDPNAMNKLSKRCKKLNTDQKLTLNYYQIAAEDFFKQQIPQNRYDFVFASHSFYFIDMELLTQILQSIKPQGFLCVILGAESSWMSFFKDLFAKASSAHGGTFIKSFKNCTVSRKWRINHQMIPTYLDLCRMCWSSPSRIDETSKNMMSLILQKNFDELTLAQKKEAYRHMSSHLDEQHMLLDGDYFLMRKIYD